MRQFIGTVVHRALLGTMLAGIALELGPVLPTGTATPLDPSVVYSQEAP